MREEGREGGRRKQNIGVLGCVYGGWSFKAAGITEGHTPATAAPALARSSYWLHSSICLRVWMATLG